jgi:hypothetical protein
MTDYYQSSNVNIPHNHRQPGRIALVAIKRLAAYQRIARQWPSYLDGRANRCTECMQNMWFNTDGHGVSYEYSDYEILSLVTAHIRQVHSEVVDDDDG